MLADSILRRNVLCILTACIFWVSWIDLQSQEITHDTPASEAQLQAWLQSGDPRLISWAATLARERHDVTFIARLPDWLHQSSLITNYGYAPNRVDRRAYAAVPDAINSRISMPRLTSWIFRKWPAHFLHKPSCLLTGYQWTSSWPS